MPRKTTRKEAAAKRFVAKPNEVQFSARNAKSTEAKKVVEALNRRKSQPDDEAVPPGAPAP